VFAIVAMLLGMVFTALIVAVGAGVVGVMYQQDNQKEVARIAPPPPQPKRNRGVDTAEEPEIEKKVKPRPKPRPKPSGGGAAPAPRPAPAPAPPPAPTGPQPVTINITDGTTFTSIEIACPSAGYRERGSFGGGASVVVPNVPTAPDCKAKFKGGVPAQASVTAGKTYTCSFVGAAANCR
jgi:hypothetical protein